MHRAGECFQQQRPRWWLSSSRALPWCWCTGPPRRSRWAAQIRVGHDDEVGQTCSEFGEHGPLDQRSLPVVASCRLLHITMRITVMSQLANLDRTHLSRARVSVGPVTNAWPSAVLRNNRAKCGMVGRVIRGLASRRREASSLRSAPRRPARRVAVRAGVPGRGHRIRVR